MYIEYNALPATDFVSSLQFKGTSGPASGTQCPVPLHLPGTRYPPNPGFTHASPQDLKRQKTSGKFGLFALSIII